MKKAMFAAAALAFSSAATAGPSWTYVDLGVVLTESAGEDTSAGGRLTGSFGFDLFHVSASYATISDAVDFGGDTDDYDTYRVAAGIHPAITDNTDMYVELGYVGGEYDDADAEPDAFDITAGVRSMITDNFELGAAAVLLVGDGDDFPGLDDDDDVQDTGLRLSGQYFFTDNFSVNVTATQGLSLETGNLNGNGDSIQIGGRFSW